MTEQVDMEFLQRFRRMVKRAAHGLHSLNLLRATPQITVVGRGIDETLRRDIVGRLAFYAKGSNLATGFADRLTLRQFLSAHPVLIARAGRSGLRPVYRMRPGVFDVDDQANRWAGWEWARLSEYLSGSVVDFVESRRRLEARVAELHAHRYEKCYLFGTGPSLDRAGDRDWSDGYRVVCNTIVRDSDLWHRLDPHFVVAGDAIYHFGHTAFARAFRVDLAARLEEGRTLFMYPARYHSIVVRELPSFGDRCVPIPMGTGSDVHRCIADRFELPGLGNVLNAMLLPLGCYLSRDIRLWGFDGRAPTDTLFWSNSNKHSYPELMDTLRSAHPAFFDQSVPKDDPERYVREVHGDVLEHILGEAEARGWTISMLHRSYTNTLQRRYAEAISPTVHAEVEAAGEARS